MLRHKLPAHGPVVHRPLKKQAVHRTKKVSTLEIIKRNVTQSPLLNLVPEIRDLIWKAAIGDRTIHIKHFSADQLKTLQRHKTYPEATEPNGAFRHIECTATISEQEAYNASKLRSPSIPAGESPAYYVQSCESRHKNCHQLDDGSCGKQAWIDLFEHGDYLINEKDRITMCTMLATCRKIYEEVSGLFWLTNTFSFDDPYSLREFLGSLTSLTLSQKHRLANLHVCEQLTGSSSGYYGFPWEMVLRKPRGRSVIDVLNGLKTLNLCLEQRFDNEDDFRMHTHLYAWLDTLSRPWLAIQHAPLVNVTVIISDKQSLMEKYGLVASRFTVQHKSEIAEQIRTNIFSEEKQAKARQDLLDKKASQKQRREELKQMKHRDEMRQQAYHILHSEYYPISIVTPEQRKAIISILRNDINEDDVEYTRGSKILAAFAESHLLQQQHTILPESYNQRQATSAQYPSPARSHTREQDDALSGTEEQYHAREPHRTYIRKRNATAEYPYLQRDHNTLQDSNEENTFDIPEHWNAYTDGPFHPLEDLQHEAHQRDQGYGSDHTFVQQQSNTDAARPAQHTQQSHPVLSHESIHTGHPSIQQVPGISMRGYQSLQEAMRDRSSDRYHPYTRLARIMDAHPAANRPHVANPRTQPYAGNPVTRLTTTANAHPVANVPNAFNIGTQQYAENPYPRPARITDAPSAAILPGVASSEMQVYADLTGGQCPAVNRRSRIEAWVEDVQRRNTSNGHHDWTGPSVHDWV